MPTATGAANAEQDKTRKHATANPLNRFRMRKQESFRAMFFLRFVLRLIFGIWPLELGFPIIISEWATPTTALIHKNLLGIVTEVERDVAK